MPYTALPDRRMPYDNDGTVVGRGDLANGITAWFSGANLITLNDSVIYESIYTPGTYNPLTVWAFFPETREVTAWHGGIWNGDDGAYTTQTIRGSTDTTNGLDGTWEVATLSGGSATDRSNLYAWRSSIKPISFTGGKKAVRCESTSGNVKQIGCLHLYGEKLAGQTPDDIIYIDHDTTPGVEFAAPEDFGDQPLGTSVVRQFRVKNTSATKTANTINIQCNDSDFTISENGTTWVVTINIASLGPGAQSATMYVRCTTPAPGALLGPRFGRIVTTVASYT